MFDFETPLDHKNYFSTKWTKYRDKDVLPLWVADSDYQTAPAIIDALQARVAHGVFSYTNQPTPDLIDAIVKHTKTHYNWKIDADWIVPLNSIVSGLTLSCLVTDEDDAEIMTPATIYPPFKYVIKNTQRNIIEVPMTIVDDRWKLDFDALENAITTNTKILLFCNPHNPGGVVYNKQELTQLLEICQRHDLLISSDEIHCDLILDEAKKHIPIASLNEDAAQRTITLMAASKTFNIAGLGCGFAIIPNKTIRQRFAKYALEMMPDVNVLGQVATTAALNSGEEWRQAQLSHLRKNHDYLFEEINKISGMKMYPLESTFLAWVDVSKLSLENAESFFADAGVGISAGAYFGDANFIRINFACSFEILQQAVVRIRKAITA